MTVKCKIIPVIKFEKNNICSEENISSSNNEYLSESDKQTSRSFVKEDEKLAPNLPKLNI